jgi:hypothetical protein
LKRWSEEVNNRKEWALAIKVIKVLRRPNSQGVNKKRNKNK